VNAEPLLHSPLWIASLGDIIESKRATGRARDKAVLGILGKPCVKKAKRQIKREAVLNALRKREAVLNALRKETERAELDLIRRRLPLPVEKRMNFLRVHLPGGGSQP
jgi:hypothetical protein